MPNYVVGWKIDIEAGSPELAAKIAREIQQDPQNTATFFEVWPYGRPFEVKEVDTDKVQWGGE